MLDVKTALKCVINTIILSVTQVSGLKEGASYILRVQAKNIAGVGGPSKATDPVVAQTRPGK